MLDQGVTNRTPGGAAARSTSPKAWRTPTCPASITTTVEVSTKHDADDAEEPAGAPEQHGARRGAGRAAQPGGRGEQEERGEQDRAAQHERAHGCSVWRGCGKAMDWGPGRNLRGSTPRRSGASGHAVGRAWWRPSTGAGLPSKLPAARTQSIRAGQVSEWLKEPVSKTGKGATPSRVRIPPCPLLVRYNPRLFVGRSSPSARKRYASVYKPSRQMIGGRPPRATPKWPGRPLPARARAGPGRHGHGVPGPRSPARPPGRAQGLASRACCHARP